MKSLLLLSLVLFSSVAIADEPDDTVNKALDYFAQGQTDAMVDYMFRQGTPGESAKAPVTAELLKLKIELQELAGSGKHRFTEKVLEQAFSRHLVRQVWVVGFDGNYVRAEFMLYRPTERWAFAEFGFSNDASANAKLIKDFRQPGYRHQDVRATPAP